MLALIFSALSRSRFPKIRAFFSRNHRWSRRIRATIRLAAVSLLLGGAGAFDAGAQTQRLLGLDVSYYQGDISQATWNSLRTSDNRQFVVIRSSRGGTTGNFVTSTTGTLSQRYDDPYYIQNINQATAAGMLAGTYHFTRADVIASTANSGGIPNNGTDEADHFIQMASPWMRPGYLPPVNDLEAGQSQRTAEELAQFCIDFSNRIYEKMKIRPAVYINGSYANYLQGTAQATRDLLAKPANPQPSVISPCYPIIWVARWPNGSGNTYTGNIQTDQPDLTYAPIYGPWDDYGTNRPWAFWQYSSGEILSSYPSRVDADVCHFGIEYLKDQLIPAIWWNDSDGLWTTLTNWNSGQTPIMPVPGPGQDTPHGTLTLPTPRLPSTNDTLILERPNTNVTITLDSGTQNIRKLYVRESLNITGGSLIINFTPSADSTTNAAQFSAPVSLSGSATVSVHTVQVDASQIFTMGGGTLKFSRIKLMPGVTPAKIAMSGNVILDALTGTNTIANGTGAGSSGWIDLSGGNVGFNVASSADLSVEVPIDNGALTKSGAGTLRLINANTYSGGTTLSAGKLLVNNSSGSGTGSGSVIVNGGILSGTGIIAGVVTVNSGGTVAPGTTNIGTLTFGSTPIFGGTNFFRIDRNGGSPLADQIARSGGALIFGGKLVVTNIGATLTGGDTFALFSANSYTGAFTATNLPPLDSGLNWYLGDLAVDGTIKVVSNVSVPPSISSGPDSLSVNGGQSAVFTVNANGAPPLAYQWQKNAILLFDGGNVSGANSASLTLSNVSSGDAASYTVVITNTFGSITSSVATLTVNTSPALITQQPQSQSVNASSNANFSVTATGATPLSFQWRFNGADLPNATNSSYSRTNAQPADVGSYSVMVTNLYGSATSSNATLTVITSPPVIDQPPTNQSVNVGATANFSVNVSGAAPMSYQWQFNGTNLANATNSNYSRTNAQSSDAGSYSVIATNIYGSTTSSNATLTVIVVPPSITAQPPSQTLIAGSSSTISVTASGSPTLTYQWYFKGSLLAGATTSAVVTNNIQPDRAGDYFVIVTNTSGAATSSVATITVNYSLSVSANGPGTVTKAPNQNSYASNAVVTLTAITNNNAAFAGWSGDATGANNPLSVTMTNNKTIVANFSNLVSIADIILDNTNAEVTLVGNWQTGSSSTDKYGSDYYFASAVSGGTSNATYRPLIVTTGNYDVFIWYSKGGNRTTNAPWSVVYNGGSTNVGVDQTGSGGQWVLIAGNRPFAAGTNGYVRLSNNSVQGNKVVIADAVKFVYSSIQNLPPVITGQPQNQTVVAGQNATFSVSASGDPPTWQWRFNGADISSATNSSYTRTNAQPADAGTYSVLVTNASGSATSSGATLTVNLPPQITNPPQNQTANQGANALFTVTATGSAPLYFQWQFNGGAIGGATDSNYTRTNAHAADAGSYQAVVTNMAGTVTSAAAVLTVNLPPLLTGQPESQSIKLGSNVTFSVTATSSTPLGYQWKFNNADIPAATDSSYLRSYVQTNDAGSYSVVVTNVAGSVISSNALLAVILPEPTQFQFITPLPDGRMRFVINGEPGATNWIERSTNLVDWQPLTNFINTNGNYEFTDDDATNFGGAFYRARK